jgi:hypothetical protein
MTNNLLDGDKTLTIQRAKKVVECSRGTPQCDDPHIKCKVKRDAVAPGQVTVIYNPRIIANGLPTSRVSGPRNLTSRRVGPVACQLCGDTSLSNARTRAMDALLAPALRDWSDERFEQEKGLSKDVYLQNDMDKACKEWMAGTVNGLQAFYALVPGNFNNGCGQPYVLKTKSLRIKIGLTMNVYWFGNNCVRQERTLPANRILSIPPKTFRLPTIKGANVSFSGVQGRASRYGREYNCPGYKAEVFCGTCYFRRDDGGFGQPTCFDPADGVELGNVASLAGIPIFDQNGAPFRGFDEARQVRDSIVSEIEAKLPQQINSAVQSLIAEASSLGSTGYIDCQPVCGLGYELNDSVEVTYER